MSSVVHQFTALEKVVTDQPVAVTLPKILQDYRKSRAFLVTSKTLYQKTNVVNSLVEALGQQLVGVFDNIQTHTPRENVLAALDAARAVKANCLLALGGGSIIDAAKAVQLALNLHIHNEQELLQYAQMADGSRGAKVAELNNQRDFDTNAVRIIAIPTTLSGAEFSNTAGVLDTASGSKEGYRAPNLYPQVIIYDPAITVHTPEWLWLSTAIRSVDHAVEGLCSPDAYPFLEGQYLHALRLFAQSLRDVKSNPSNLEARSLNQQAVWLACCGLGRVSHGASHGIGYILGSLCGVPHGYTSCVMLPAVLQWNKEVIAHRDRDIAKALNSPEMTASQAVKTLVAELGLPTSLRDLKVTRDQLPEIAQWAAQHRVVRSNPRAIASAADVLEILELAW